MALYVEVGKPDPVWGMEELRAAGEREQNLGLIRLLFLAFRLLVLVRFRNFPWLPVRRHRRQPQKLVFGAARLHPVDDVALEFQVRQRQHANATGNAVQRSGYLLRVGAARVVVVGQQHDVLSAQAFRIFRVPFAGASRIAGGAQAPGAQRVYVLLAFRNEDRTGLLQQLGQAIQNATHALQVVNPSDMSVQPPLIKTFAGCTADLKQQLALLVAVVEGGDERVVLD